MTLNIFKKIKIGREVKAQIPKEKYLYLAYRVISIKYKISENTARECCECFMAYNAGREGALI